MSTNAREAIKIELDAAIDGVTKIRRVVEEAEDINGIEATAVHSGLEMFVNKFKLKIPQVAVESIVGNKEAAIRYCNSVITSLESRVETMHVIE